jgi:hypothetical protein
MPADRKTVRFIARALDHVQCFESEAV